MPQRPFIFLDGDSELVLPVTPASYRVDCGANVEVINIHQLGDVIVMGYGTLATIKIDCLFPARPYSFALDNDPEAIVEQFQQWIRERSELRFIVGNTGVNIPVKVENISYGESDGTGDVYAALILREYRSLPPVEITPAAASKSRTPAAKPPSSTDLIYPIEYGDTLSGLCQKYYGDASAAVYQRLASYNNIPNPHLIYVGNTLKIPQPLPEKR